MVLTCTLNTGFRAKDKKENVIVSELHGQVNMTDCTDTKEFFLTFAHIDDSAQPGYQPMPIRTINVRSQGS